MYSEMHNDGSIEILDIKQNRKQDIHTIDLVAAIDGMTQKLNNHYLRP